LKSCGIESLAVLERRHNTAAILIIVLVALVVVSTPPTWITWQCLLVINYIHFASPRMDF